jgi:CMP-N,N'-diacetyllegionaminic acid synthase
MTIAIIPARGGSKGIPRKNLVEIAGKSLLQRTVETALQSDKFTSVYLDTDDHEIADIGRTCGAIVPFMRPSHLATDTAGILDSLRYFLAKVDHGVDFGNTGVVLLQPTSPLRTSDEIVKCISAWEDKKGSHSVISVSEPLQSIKDFININEDGSLSSVVEGDFRHTNRQSSSSIRFISGSIYVFSLRFLELHGTLVTKRNTICIELSQESSIDVDTLFDLHLAKLLSENPAHG